MAKEVSMIKKTNQIHAVTVSILDGGCFGTQATRVWTWFALFSLDWICLETSSTNQHHKRFAIINRTLQISVGHHDKIYEDSTLSNKNQPTPIPDGPYGQIFYPRGGADQRKLHILVTWFATACFFKCDLMVVFVKWRSLKFWHILF